MATWPRSRKKRVTRYSNPDVEYDDVAIGTSTRNNAAAISNHGCTISAFEDPDLFDSNIEGPVSADKNSSISLTAEVTGGTEPLTIDWDVSEDGVNFSSAGNGVSINHTLNYSAPQTVFFRIKVTSASGEIDYATRGVFVLPILEEIVLPPTLSEDDIVKFGDVYPNPAFGGSIKIPIKVLEEGDIAISAYGQNGSRFDVLKSRILPIGEYIFTHIPQFKTTDFIIYEIRANGKTYRKKVIIIND